MVLERNGVVADVLRSGSTSRALTSVSPSTHCKYMAGASLCSYSAPGLRWFLASNLETSAVWVCGVRGAGNLTTLKFTSKGVRHARAVLGDSETQDPWWCGGSHPPDMGRPKYGSARMVYTG